MGVTVRPLVSYLARVSDPRKAKGLRHPLDAILCLRCLALMAGAKTPKGISNWWKNRCDLGPSLGRLGFTKSYGPSKSTLYRVLAMVPIEALEAVLNQWAEDNMIDRPPSNDELDGAAMDGKTLRGSLRQGAEQIHLLSVLSHRLRLTLKQLAIDDRTNESGLFQICSSIWSSTDECSRWMHF